MIVFLHAAADPVFVIMMVGINGERFSPFVAKQFAVLSTRGDRLRRP